MWRGYLVVGVWIWGITVFFFHAFLFFFKSGKLENLQM